MSRFLITNWKILFFAFLTGVLFSCYFKLWIFAVLFIVLLLGCLSFKVVIYTNALLLNKICYPLSKLHHKREIKSYRNLIIGDFAAPSCYQHLCEKGESLVVTSPDRTLEATWHILAHIESILDEKGTCIIIDSTKQAKTDISTFDIHYLSLVSRLELKIDPNTFKYRYPLLSSPITCLKILLKDYSTGFVQKSCPDNRIVSLCKRKGFHLIYLTKK